MNPPDLPDFTDEYELIRLDDEKREPTDFWAGFIAGLVTAAFWLAVVMGARAAGLV